MPPKSSLKRTVVKVAAAPASPAAAAPASAHDLNFWFQQAATAGTPIHTTLHRRGADITAAVLASVALLSNADIRRAFRQQQKKKESTVLDVLDSLLRQRMSLRQPIDVGAVVKVTYSALFASAASRLLDGEAWLLALQEAHWKATPVPQRESQQDVWLDAKLRHANRRLSLFLRTVVGSPHSFVFTGVKRVHVAIGREIRASGADGRRQLSATFWRLQSTFVGGDAALQALAAPGRLPRSDASLLQTVLVPSLLKPAAGLAPADLPAALTDLQVLMDIIFTTTPSKNGMIRQVKMVVRRHYDESRPAIFAALKGLHVKLSDRIQADQDQHEQRTFNSRHPILVEHDHVLEVIEDNLDSLDWRKRLVAVLLNTGSRLMEAVMLSDYEQLTPQAASLSAVRSRCAAKLAVSDSTLLTPPLLQSFFPSSPAFTAALKSAGAVLAKNPLRRLSRRAGRRAGASARRRRRGGSSSNSDEDEESTSDDDDASDDDSDSDGDDDDDDDEEEDDEEDDSDSDSDSNSDDDDSDSDDDDDGDTSDSSDADESSDDDSERGRRPASSRGRIVSGGGAGGSDSRSEQRQLIADSARVGGGGFRAAGSRRRAPRGAAAPRAASGVVSPLPPARASAAAAAARKSRAVAQSVAAVAGRNRGRVAAGRSRSASPALASNAVRQTRSSSSAVVLPVPPPRAAASPRRPRAAAAAARAPRAGGSSSSSSPPSAPVARIQPDPSRDVRETIDTFEQNADGEYVAWTDAHYLQMLADPAGGDLSALYSFTTQLVNSNWLRVSCLSKKRGQPALRHRPMVLQNSAQRTVTAVLYVRATIQLMLQSRPQWNTLTKIRQALSNPLNEMLRSPEFFHNASVFVPHVGNMKRRINSRFTRQVYGNITYNAYAPTMSRNAWLSAVLGHQLFNEEVSLSYVGVKVTEPMRRVPPPVLQRLMTVERELKRLKQTTGANAVQRIVHENDVERGALAEMVTRLERLQLGGGGGGGDDDDGGVFDLNPRFIRFQTGRRGDAARQTVSIERNQRRDSRPVGMKIAEKAAELRAAGVVVSHRTLKRVGFGTDSARQYLRARRAGAGGGQ